MVAEIGRLFVEYPEEDWRVLARGLREGTLIGDVAEAIDALLASGGTSQQVAVEAVSHPRRENVIARVARDDPAKAEKLFALKSWLTRKDSRPTLAVVRGFAASLGMKEELAKRRDQAVNQIVRHLAAQRTDEIDDIVVAAMPRESVEGQEYDRWVKLILGVGSG